LVLPHNPSHGLPNIDKIDIHTYFLEELGVEDSCMTEPAAPQQVVPLELGITLDVEVGVKMFFFFFLGQLLLDLRIGLLKFRLGLLG
jgi:hypothetical protein